MATMEKCYGCGLVYKHHELIRHRKVTSCGVEHPIRNVRVKEALRLHKKLRINAKWTRG